MSTEVQLRSKRALIEQFIESNLSEFVGQMDVVDVHGPLESILSRL